MDAFPIYNVSHRWVSRVQHDSDFFRQVSLDELREVTCRQCGRVFYLCRSCDRGQCYCSDECRATARRAKLQRARAKYAHSARGRENNRLRQRRFRQCRYPPLRSIKKIEKSVTDHPSHEGQGMMSWGHDQHETLPGPPPRHHGHRSRHPTQARFCHICGRPGRVVRRSAARGRFRWAR